MSDEPKIILCIPGNWNDRTHLVTSLVQANHEQYIFAGNVLLHIPTGDTFEVEIYEPDPRLEASFGITGQGRFTPEELAEIGKHSSVIYLVGPGGGTANAEKMMRAGQAFLDAGAAAVKVETTGKSFTKALWTALTKYEGGQKFYEAFVVLLRSEDGTIYSCGMHNLGLRDTRCSLDLEPAEITDAIDIFSLYQLMEQPVIRAGQTFSTSENSRVFRIVEADCTIYQEGDLFYNPFGMYGLEQG